MAKHRKTLEQKKRSLKHRHEQSQHVSQTPATPSTFTYRSNGVSANLQSGSKAIDNEDSILAVPSRYIVKDLLKTVALSLLFLCLIGVAYWYFNKGGHLTVQPLLQSFTNK